MARRVLLKALDVGLHDFLFGLQEAHDLEQGITVMVEDQNIAEFSDGLHGEPWSEDGWIARFSQYPQSE